MLCAGLQMRPPGANSPFWVYRLGERAEGRPRTTFKTPSRARDWGPLGPPALWDRVPTIPSSHPTGPPRCRPGCSFSSQLEELGLAGAGWTGGGEAGGEGVIYISEQIRVLDKP